MGLSLNTGFSSPVSIAELGIRVDDPIQHVQDCHRKIERSLVTVQNAVASHCLTEPVLRTEATAALDYELTLLRLLTMLHTQDEEESLFPRLRAASREGSQELKELTLILESQHRQEDAVFEELAALHPQFFRRSGVADGGTACPAGEPGDATVQSHWAPPDPRE